MVYGVRFTVFVLGCRVQEGWQSRRHANRSNVSVWMRGVGLGVDDWGLTRLEYRPRACVVQGLCGGSNLFSSTSLNFGLGVASAPRVVFHQEAARCSADPMHVICGASC